MNKATSNIQKRARRQKRIRAKVKGTEERPRLAVFKSNTAIYAQIINDDKGATLVSASSAEIKSGTMLEKAAATGKALAVKAKENNITMVVFDRGGFMYTGRIKALANGARDGGLIF